LYLQRDELNQTQPRKKFLALLVQEPLRQEIAFPTSMCYCPKTDPVSQPTLSITNHPKVCISAQQLHQMHVNVVRLLVKQNIHGD